MSGKRTPLICLLFSSLAFFSCFGPGQVTIVPPAATPAGDEAIMRKISPLLSNQIALRLQQMRQPTGQRLEHMQGIGMDVNNLNIQRVFIHLPQLPNANQIQDLRTLGVTLYLDSWIPPTGNSPTGFLLGDMPVNVLRELASKDYVVKLETAERFSQPQGGFKTQDK